MKRITIVEDNEDNRVLLEALLGDLYELELFVDGPTALAGVTEPGPDLLLLDISLPGMSGVELLGRLRTRPWLRGVPMVALTAHAMTGDRERYLAAGFDEHIGKPILDEEALRATLDRLLER